MSTADAKKSPTAPEFPGLLVEMTIDEIRTFRPEVVVLPLGSTEPHGSHLPLGTDTYLAEANCRKAVAKANARGARALLYPALPITNNSNMRKIPFALRIGIRTLMQVLIDIATQCYEDGIRKMVILNAHGGNPATLNAALREIAGMDNMPFVCISGGIFPNDFVTPIENSSDHAGEGETSCMLAAQPHLVRTDKLTDYPRGELAVPLLQKTQFVRPWHHYLPETAGGETRASTSEKGNILLETGSDGLAQLLLDLTNAPYSEYFPYRKPD